VDPILIRGTAKRYVLFNLHRGLFFYNQKNQITAHGAKTCFWSNSKPIYTCLLSDKKWSDGTAITADHYVHSFNQIKQAKEESLQYVSGIKSMKSDGSRRLKIEFSKRTEDVNHRLTPLVLAPRNLNQLFQESKDQLFSGPYALKSLTKKHIILKSSPFFNDSKRPDVKGVFVDDPSAALNMYEAKRLDFLRYLESSNVASYDDVLFAPFAKLDGLFFNPLKLSVNARKALLLSLDFTKLKKLYKSPSTPGCLAVPKSFFSKPLKCLEFEPKKAKEFKNLSELSEAKLKIHIPQAGADEHKKLALWAQAEWKRNLSLSVQIEIVESKTFYENVEKSKYAIYRKASPLEDLSCSSSIRNLKDQKEFKDISVKSKKFKKDVCSSFFKQALARHFWLPLGMPYYAHLPSKKFFGYYINLLGQFGLENLERNKKDLEKK